IGMLRQRRLHVERDKMHLGAGALGEMPGKLVIGAVHAAKRGEIAGDDDEAFGSHTSSALGNCASPCSTPARNQYCKPICVVNGVNPNTSASTPAFDAKIIAAYGPTEEWCSLTHTFSS